MTTEKQKVKKITLADRKKAQPKAYLYFSEDEKLAISNTVAKDLLPAERSIFFYQCQALGLNPLLYEICAIVYTGKKGRKMSIQVMRDGFLTIAHRSGKFAGIESGVYEADEKRKNMVGWAKVYHRDYEHPVYQEVDFNEYNAPERNILWKTKPKTMIKKVAESMALRKAFNVSGVYAPEEMDLEIATDRGNGVKHLPESVDDNKIATEQQVSSIKAMGGEVKEPEKLSFGKAKQLILDLANKKKGDKNVGTTGSTEGK